MRKIFFVILFFCTIPNSIHMIEASQKIKGNAKLSKKSSLRGKNGIVINLPTSLTLSHTANSKTFTVGWTAGSNNGGSGSCRIEYLKSNGLWATVLSPTTVNCDQSGASIGTVTLPGDGWFGSGSWQSNPKSVRLVRVSDEYVIGTLGSLTCSSTAGSITSTPNIDEDCDGQWNDVFSNLCNEALATKTFGASFTCPSTGTCVATTNTFYHAYWSMNGGSSVIFWVSSGCPGAETGYGTMINSVSTTTGTVPSRGVHAPELDLGTTGVCTQSSFDGYYYKNTVVKSEWDNGWCYYSYNEYQ